jgi:hypothetical protein
MEIPTKKDTAKAKGPATCRARVRRSTETKGIRKYTIKPKKARAIHTLTSISIPERSRSNPREGKNLEKLSPQPI